MNTQTFLKLAGSVFLYLFLQIFILGNLVFFDIAFCFVYISIFLFLPLSFEITLQLLMALVVGLIIDLFNNSAGLHASAALVLVFLRPYILKVLFPAKGIENELLLTVEGMGLERFIRYILILTFIHHSYLFFLEAGNHHHFLNTSLRIVASVIFTSLVVFLFKIYFKSLQ